MNGIPVYEDPYMEDGKVLKGRKGTYKDKQTTFLIANPKTISLLYISYKKRLRKEKLIRILNDTQ